MEIAKIDTNPISIFPRYMGHGEARKGIPIVDELKSLDPETVRRAFAARVEDVGGEYVSNYGEDLVEWIEAMQAQAAEGVELTALVWTVAYAEGLVTWSLCGGTNDPEGILYVSPRDWGETAPDIEGTGLGQPVGDWPTREAHFNATTGSTFPVHNGTIWSSHLYG